MQGDNESQTDKPLVLVFDQNSVLSSDATFCELPWKRLSYLSPVEIIIDETENSETLKETLNSWHETGRAIRNHHHDWYIYSAEFPYRLLGHSDKCGIELIQEELQLTAQAQRNDSSHE